jgi:hypothetical protein
VKLEGSAMGFALVFTVVVSAAIAGLFNLASFHAREAEKSLDNFRVADECISALNFGVCYPNATNFTSIPDAQLKSFNWGLFHVTTASIAKPHLRLHKSVMSGYECNSQLALYLADKNKPLFLAGSTIIGGNTLIPRSGIKPAYIEGKPFQNNQRIAGKQNISERFIPATSLDVHNLLKNISMESSSPQDTIISINEVSQSMSKYFHSGTAFLLAHDNIDLNNISLDGRIVIYAPKHKVTVSKNSKMQDIIVYADEIIFKENFIGSIQAIALYNITIESNVILNFPSAAMIIRRNGETRISEIVMHNDSYLEGILAIISTAPNEAQRAKIIINKDAIVKGQVYSCDKIDLKGAAYGTVWCNGITLKTASGIYENHLMDAKIIRDSLPDKYYGAIVGTSSKKNRIKWLK